MNLPSWVPTTTITLLTRTTGTGPTGTGTSSYTPTATTFEGHWQPMSAADAVKSGRSGVKETREIWTQDAAADAVTTQSAVQFDGKKWAVVAREAWQEDPVVYLLVELIG